MPFPQKTIQPATQMGGMAGGDKYVHQGLFFKLSRDVTGAYGGDEQASAAAHHEMDALAALLAANIPGLHFPLTAVISYCGHTVLVSSLLPISNETLVYGSADGGSTIVNQSPEMDRMMRLVGQTLNLKEHVVAASRAVQLRPTPSLSSSSESQTWTTLHGPADMEGHLGRDGRFYVVDMARLFPPEAPTPDSPKGCILFRLLRPELVAQAPTPLSSDAFSRMGRHNHHIHNTEVAALTTTLYDQVIPDLAAELVAVDSMAILRRHYLSLEYFQSCGLSLRHLGALRSHIPLNTDGSDASPVPELLRNNLLSYMVATTFVGLLHAALRSSLRSSHKPGKRKDLIVRHFNALLAWRMTDPFDTLASLSKTRLKKPGRRCPLGAFWCSALFRGVSKRFPGFPDKFDGPVPKPASVPVASTAASCPRCAWLRSSIDRVTVFERACIATGIKFDVTHSYLEPESMPPLALSQLAGVGVVSRHLRFLPLTHTSSSPDAVYASELVRLASLLPNPSADALATLSSSTASSSSSSSSSILFTPADLMVGDVDLFLGSLDAIHQAGTTSPGQEEDTSSVARILKAMVAVHLNMAELRAAEHAREHAVEAFRSGLTLATRVWTTTSLPLLSAWQQYADFLAQGCDSFSGQAGIIARHTYEWILQQLEAGGVSRPRMVVEVLNNLANVLSSLGLEPQAGETYAKALGVGPDAAASPPSVSFSLARVSVFNNYALLSARTGESDQAIALCHRGLKVLDTVGSPGLGARAMILNNMAVLVERVLIDAGDMGDALGPRTPESLSGSEERVFAMHAKAHHLKVKVYGPASPEAATSAFNLARFAVLARCYQAGLDILSSSRAPLPGGRALAVRAYMGLEKYAEALPLLHAEIREARELLPNTASQSTAVTLLKRIHDDTLTLSAALRECCQVSGARRTLMELLMALASVYGTNHPVLCPGLWELGQVFVAECNFVAAEKTLSILCALCDAAYGPEVTALSGYMAGLGHLQCGLGTPSGPNSALQLFEFDLATAELAHGSSSPSIVDALCNLGRCYLHLERGSEAKAVLERALEVSREATEPIHLRSRAGVLNNLGLLALSQGAVDDSESLFRRALFICERIPGGNDLSLALILTNLAFVYLAQGNYIMADSMLLQALRLKSASLSPSHPSVVANLEMLAVLAAKRGDLPRSQKMLASAVQVVTRGCSHPDGEPDPLVLRLKSFAAHLSESNTSPSRVDLAPLASESRAVGFILNHLVWAGTPPAHVISPHRRHVSESVFALLPEGANIQQTYSEAPVTAPTVRTTASTTAPTTAPTTATTTT